MSCNAEHERFERGATLVTASIGVSPNSGSQVLCTRKKSSSAHSFTIVYFRGVLVPGWLGRSER